MNKVIPVDSIRNKKIYQIGNNDNFFHYNLKKDSVFIVSSAGGLDGNASYTFKGFKTK